MPDFGACKSTTKDSKIKLEQQGAQIIFLNNERTKITKIQMDACPDPKKSRCEFNGCGKQGKGCDYLLIKNSVEHFVELKSKSNIAHGIEQLKYSIQHIHEKSNKQINSYLISKTNNIPNFTAEKQRFVHAFKTQLQCTLHFVKSGTEQAF